MAASARLHSARLSPATIRLLVLVGVAVAFWLLVLLFGSSAAKADTPPQDSARSVTTELAGSLHHTAQRAVKTITGQATQLTRLSQHVELRVTSRVPETTHTVHELRTVIVAVVQKPIRVAVDVVKSRIAQAGRITDTPVPVRGSSAATGPRPTAARPAPAPSSHATSAAPSPAARPSVEGPAATTRLAHDMARLASVDVRDADRSQRTPHSPTVPMAPPASPAVGDGNTPGVNRGSAHDVPAVPAPTQSAAHRERAGIALWAFTSPLDGTPPPRPGFSPD